MRRRILYAALGVLLLVLAVLAGGLAWLARHPVELPFLTPRIEAALARADGSKRLEIARTQLAFDLSEGIVVRLIDARALDAHGGETVRFPELAVDLSARELLRGRIAVTGLELDSPAARVVREADGRVDVVLEDQAPAVPADEAPLQLLLAELADPATALGLLQRVWIHDAELRFEDRVLGLSFAAPRVELELERQPDGLAARAELALDLDGSPGELSIRVSWSWGASHAVVESRLTRVDLRPLLAAFLEPAERAGLPSIPVGGSIESRWQLDAGLAPVEASFSLAGALRAAAPRVSGPDFTLSGSLAGDGSGDRLDLELRLEPLEVSGLGRWWPAALAGETRAWVVENVPSGRVRNARVALSARVERRKPVRAELISLTGGLEAEALEVRYLAPLPEARGVEASASFDAARWDFAIAGGEVRDVAIRGGRVSILGLRGKAVPRLDLELALEAPVPSLLEILKLPPLELAPEFESERLQGQAQGRLTLALPLEDPKPEDVEFGVEADVRDAAISFAAPSPSFDGGELHVSVRRDELAVSGTGRVGGRPARFSFARHLPDASGIDRFELSGTLEKLAERPPLGFEMHAERNAERWLEGEARFELEGGRHTSAVYTAQRSDRVLAVRSADLGALIAAFSGSKRLQGGRLRVDGAAPDPAAPLAGSFELAHFTLAETAILSRLLELLRLRELRARLVADGLEWTTVQGDFRQVAGGVEIRGAHGAGGSLAFTLDGTVELGSREVALRGEIVPIPSVNTLVREIPLLGRLATGGGGGLVSAPFRVSGTLDAPLVRVDPWSTLVPAPLRKLVGAGAAAGRAGAAALPGVRR